MEQNHIHPDIRIGLTKESLSVFFGEVWRDWIQSSLDRKKTIISRTDDIPPALLCILFGQQNIQQTLIFEKKITFQS
jgi:hypothetical protein